MTWLKCEIPIVKSQMETYKDACKIAVNQEIYVRQTFLYTRSRSPSSGAGLNTVGMFWFIEISKRLSIHNVLNVFCTPSPGLAVVLMQILNKTLEVYTKEVVNMFD